MVGGTLKDNFEPTLPHDGFHNREREIQSVKDRPLFDVKFEIAEGVVVRLRLGNSDGVKAESSDRFAHRYPVAIARFEQLVFASESSAPSSPLVEVTGA